MRGRPYNEPGQLVFVRGVLQLMRRVGQGGELHRIAGEAQAAATEIRDLRPAHAGAVAALLRHKVMGQVVPRRRAENAKPAPSWRST